MPLPHTCLSTTKIRVIQVLLGHKKLENTARYSQVAAKLLREVKGPLEYLEIKPPE
jgi:site-specific recombinase XerD